MYGDDDDLVLLDNDPEETKNNVSTWNVMVVDDDTSVHDGTRYALADYHFEGRPVSVLSAFSAEEAKALLLKVEDVAVILLDVVMETDDAGLQFAKYVRDEIKNKTTRIILRTGQPGQAPERKVIVDYDLNDYKSKSLLTDTQLFISLTVALRSYEQIVNISAQHQALLQIIEISELASTDPSLQTFFSAALSRLGTMLHDGNEGFILIIPDVESVDDPIHIDGGSGRFEGMFGPAARILEGDPAVKHLTEIASHQETSIGDSGCIFYLPRRQGGRVAFVFPDAYPRMGLDAIAITAFCGKLSVVYDNVSLVNVLKEMSLKLEGQVESISNEAQSLRRTMVALSETVSDKALKYADAFAGLYSSSRKMFDVFRYIEAIIDSAEPVLLMGEVGVGKAELAQIIHTVNKFKGPFVNVNLSGLSDHEMVDALFGHKRGAFAGADRVLSGAVFQAANGTLYIDEISRLGPSGQARLLTLLTDKTYITLGSELPSAANIHLIVGTSVGLEHLVSEGQFRSDLYFRLCSHKINIPPLRDRIEDLPMLVSHFIEQAAATLNKSIPEPPEELFDLLSVYNFPGSVPELRAMCFAAMSQHEAGHILSISSFREAISNDRKSPNLPTDQLESVLHIDGRFPTLEKIENLLIKEALAACRV
jgi:DNA-binding NtrC family response regulator